MAINLKEMSEAPLVSIIIPVFNAEKYLARCLESVIAQTWPNKEIIIVNDGSTDSSIDIATIYTCDWIKVFNQPNMGASSARNKGLRHAQGEYIQFLDADDFISLDKIENQVTILMKNPGKLAVCSTIHFHDEDELTWAMPSAYEDSFLIESSPNHFLINLWGGYSDRGSMIQPNAWLSPRTILEKAGWWNEQISLDDDGEYFCRVILASIGVKKTAGYNYYRKYRALDSLSTARSHQAMKSILLSVTSKKNNLLKKDNQPEAEYAIYKLLMDVMVFCYGTYPDIYQLAVNELPEHSPPGYLPSIGGPLAVLMSRLFGWKAVRRLQLGLKKLL